MGFSFPAGGAVLSAAVNAKSTYGLKGDGVTDDSAAMWTAISTEVTNAIANGTYFATLYFPPGIYLLNGPFVQGGATRGNAIVPLPLCSITAQKVTLVLEGAGDATALPHWHQTVTQQNGTVFKTTRSDGTNDASGRVVTDGVTHSTDIVDSATLAPTTADVGRYVTGGDIAAGTWVKARLSATQIQLSQAATGSGSGRTITLSGFGEASILGGPTPAEGYGPTWNISDPLFSNMLLSISGITFVFPANPTVSGLDARCLAEFNFGTLATQADQIPSTATIPAHTWQFGVAMPQAGNNDNSNGVWYSCEGAYFGLLAGEHAAIQSVRCIYCADGIYFQPSTPHGCWIGYASIEACAVCINTSPSSSYTKIVIDNLDYEDGVGGFAPQAHIYDPSSVFFGSVGLQTNNTPFSPIVNGAANLDVKSLQAGKGHVAPPAIPATTVAYRNVFWRDAAVTIVGGTVTVIAVDGTATGVTSGTVIVPAGKNIAITYSVVPTSWNWVLL